MAQNPFTAHPHANGETYGQPFGIAFGVGRQLLSAAFAAITHALMPFLFPTTASDKIRALNDCLDRNDRDGLRRKARLANTGPSNADADNTSPATPMQTTPMQTMRNSFRKTGEHAPN